MKKQISTREAEQLINLIEAAKEKFSIKDLMFYFMDSLNGWKEQTELIKTILADNNFKDEIKEEFKSEMKGDGFLIIKMDSLEKQNKLNDFLTTVIYPYYNEQQANLFN